MLRRLFVCGALVLVFAAPAHAAAPTGTLEICKSSANGMAGRSFVFAIGGSAGTGEGGRRTGPVSVPAGEIAVTQLGGEPGADVRSGGGRAGARQPRVPGGPPTGGGR